MMAKAALIQMRTADFSVYLLVTLIYVALGLCISGTFTVIEKRVRLT